MKFAINYSPAVEEVLHLIEKDFDFCKCNEWPSIKEPAKKLKPIYIHFPNNVGNKSSEPDWQMIEDNLQESESPLVNVHLRATVEDYPHIPIDSIENVYKEEILSNVMKDLEQYCKRFGAENIIIENLPFWSPRRTNEIGVLRASIEPDVFTTIINATGIGLLFDIDHARTACYYTNVPLEEYAKQLPMHALKELHMTGTRMYDGWLEAHLEMREEDWPYFEWALQNITNGSWATPEIFANEYSGTGPQFAWRSEPQYITEQVPKFAKLLRKYQLRN